MVKKTKKNPWGYLFFGVLIFILGFAVSQVIDEFKKIPSGIEFTPQTIPYSEQEIINNCLNLDVVNSSLCLRDNVETFFIYNVTDDEKARSMSFEEIKKIGTDCGGYAYFYKRLAENLGFESTTRKWEGLMDVFPGHRWAVIWDDQHYCRIDMLYVNCFEIENETFNN